MKLSREQVGCRNIVAMLHVMSSEVRMPCLRRAYMSGMSKFCSTLNLVDKTFFYFFKKFHFLGWLMKTMTYHPQLTSLFTSSLRVIIL